MIILISIYRVEDPIFEKSYVLCCHHLSKLLYWKIIFYIQGHNKMNLRTGTMLAQQKMNLKWFFLNDGNLFVLIYRMEQLNIVKFPHQ